jgi:hypothetical protein
LFADERSGRKLSEKEIASRLSVHFQTVHSIRKMYTLFGLDVALGRKKRLTPPITPKITGDIEAKIIALSCSSPPEGRSRWTLRLLADKVVELRIVESISHETIHRTLKKRIKTTSAYMLGHPAPPERSIRRLHGGCAGSISAAL